MNEYIYKHTHRNIEKNQSVMTSNLDTFQFIAIFVVLPSLYNCYTVFLLGIELEFFFHILSEHLGKVKDEAKLLFCVALCFLMVSIILHLGFLLNNFWGKKCAFLIYNSLW